MADDDEWEYGFYDSHPDGNWWEEPKPQENPTIYWWVFGILKHNTAESAQHTGAKSCSGYPVIVRRHPDAEEWEHVQTPQVSGNTDPKGGTDER